MAPVSPDFEQGPIRPPSEAHSLLVRVMRNCTWNRCTFCPVYKGRRASQRSLEEVLADVDAMAVAAKLLGGPDAPAQTMLAALEGGAVPRNAMQVALFLRAGGKTAFLQDADPCAVRPDKLAAVLARMRERFPTMERVTTYGRAATLSRRRPDDLGLLVSEGLTRIHLGLESGDDAVLTAVCKGTNQAQLIEAGRRVLGAGLELCYYVMPGLGGSELAEDNVRGTAHVIRAVAAAGSAERPLMVRIRTTAVKPGTPLAEREREGTFTLPHDVEIVRELRTLLDQVGDARFELRSDHELNLLPELQGSLPADRERLIALLDGYLALREVEQAEYALGARLGIFRRLADLDDPGRMEALRLRTGSGATAAELLSAADSLRSRHI